MGEPFGAAGVHSTNTAPGRDVPCTAVASPGRPAGVTEAEVKAAPAPTALMATTSTVMASPLMSPSMTQEVADSAVTSTEQVADESPVTDARYDVTGEPFAAGVDHETVARPSPRTTTTPDGASGTPAGTTASETEEDVLVPTLLVALTVNRYDTPLISPRTTQVSGSPATGTATHVSELSDTAVTRNDRMGAPLSEPGVQLTRASRSPRVTATSIGDSGAAAGTTEAEAADDTLSPTAFSAVTVKV
ncbi:unannotated protein [freshwater metagenome]|uniref:Unannotated protein n=1 Tax=freshwater metagenome TaxID=449393 RepID=A0A6J5YIB1_9ZZZZ